ncbi:MAG: hypothetical protein ACI90V_004179 [Bacillariaceae sp.]|jgi:hypothetical protein
MAASLKERANAARKEVCTVIYRIMEEVKKRMLYKFYRQLKFVFAFCLVL